MRTPRCSAPPGWAMSAPWAMQHLPRREDRNAFFNEVGQRLEPRRETTLAQLDHHLTPDAILKKLR
jgi:hypothetical protein